MRDADGNAVSFKVGGDDGLHVIIGTALGRQSQTEKFVRGILRNRRRISQSEYHDSIGSHDGFCRELQLIRVQNRFGIGQGSGNIQDPFLKNIEATVALLDVGSDVGG